MSRHIVKDFSNPKATCRLDNCNFFIGEGGQEKEVNKYITIP